MPDSYREHLGRLAQMTAELWPRVLAGDAQASQLLLACLRQRARVLRRLGKPPRHELRLCESGSPVNFP